MIPHYVFFWQGGTLHYLFWERSCFSTTFFSDKKLLLHYVSLTSAILVLLWRYFCTAFFLRRRYYLFYTTYFLTRRYFYLISVLKRKIFHRTYFRTIFSIHKKVLLHYLKTLFGFKLNTKVKCECILNYVAIKVDLKAQWEAPREASVAKQALREAVEVADSLEGGCRLSWMRSA